MEKCKCCQSERELNKHGLCTHCTLYVNNVIKKANEEIERIIEAHMDGDDVDYFDDDDYDSFGNSFVGNTFTALTAPFIGKPFNWQR